MLHQGLVLLPLLWLKLRLVPTPSENTRKRKNLPEETSSFITAPAWPPVTSFPLTAPWDEIRPPDLNTLVLSKLHAKLPMTYEFQYLAQEDGLDSYWPSKRNHRQTNPYRSFR
jgi:hypothetical protein